MYQNCCKKCGSIELHTEVKGNNTGLYCNDCGAWIKWLGKDELKAMIADGETIEVNCHFCNSKYHVPVEKLQSLLKLAL